MATKAERFDTAFSNARKRGAKTFTFEGKKYSTEAAGMTVSATPRVMSALPPRTRIKDADVQGDTTKETATRVEGTRSLQKWEEERRKKSLKNEN
jgi:hypothetical protein